MKEWVLYVFLLVAALTWSLFAPFEIGEFWQEEDKKNDGDGPGSSFED